MLEPKTTTIRRTETGMENLRKVITIAVLGALIFGAFWGIGLISSMKEDEKIGVTNDGLVPNGGIAAIDASAPKRTETATFALG
jgi:hypothetical protein